MAEFESTGPLMTASLWPITFICAVFLGLRLYTKLRFRGRLWWDDYILLFSWICLLIEVSMIQRAISFGFGMHMVDLAATKSRSDIIRFAIYVRIGLSFAILSINFSRVSFAVTMLMLTTGWWKSFVWLAIISLIMMMIPALVLPWAYCQPLEKAFDHSVPGTCVFSTSVNVSYGTFEAGLSAFFDFALAMLPWKVIWGLQMLRAEKIGLGMAMSLGIFSGAITIIRAISIVRMANHDLSYYGAYVTIWNTTEPACAIIAASIPILRVFVQEKNSSYHPENQGYPLSTVGGTANVISLRPIEDRKRTDSQTWITSHADDESDKINLRENAAPSGYEIVQTNTFTIEYVDENRSHNGR
ncbi:Uu.00g094380.m01.CDS01 [Anthostomella pinea]|uniref:Uu.00g094380.m01.CDS01 n=1 Tax=Anthostomella pinea TaxID=933095 RepID=A0AAI8YKN9_9PEZI|nr:Uu.00g094380.m01.CDS01 [Anthostomella pinea]